jgi:hypothetical protein
METIASVSARAGTLPSRLSTLALLEITCRPCDTTRASARTLPASLVMGRAKLPLVSIVV